MNAVPISEMRGAAVVCMLAAFAFCATARAADPAQELTQTLRDYERVWSGHDAQAIANFYF